MEPDFQGLQWPQNTRTGLGISANFWVDSAGEWIRRGRDVLPDTDLKLQQGRAVLRLTPAYVNGRMFAQAQVELVGNLCQSTTTLCTTSGTFSTDDLWIRVGAWNIWDLKVGRFEGWEIYHLGMGMDQYTVERLGAGMFGVDTMMTTPHLEAPTFYGVTFMHDRPADGLAVGDIGLHLYPTDSLRFELLGKLGADTYHGDIAATGDTPWTYYGGRPTIIFDVGWFKLRLGGEYQKRTTTTQTIAPGPMKKDAAAERKQMGVGGSVQFVIDPIVEFGANAAFGKQDDTSGFGAEVPETTFTTKSLGGFLNVRVLESLLAGGGVHWTTLTSDFLAAGSTAKDFTGHIQGFGAVQYRPLGQLYIKLVVSYASAAFLPSDLSVPEWHNHMYSVRLRLLYIY